ncbi:Dak1 domain-containing protein [Dactylonectria estremocensis]|uniref:Dak1 domain-containing protein n=1 Tax=Dactylonectria estremocensis TaxID=1079267 RepID=A0A9P9JBN1_9HYPO|nr:Dak1 domain-containing protein [Dactylonectria estremocensis]
MGVSSPAIFHMKLIVRQALKAVGAAAQAKKSFERCVDIGKAVNDSLVTIGRQAHETISKDVCVVGSGIHNEPGVEHISPFPSVESLIRHCLNQLCDPDDKERAFVSFENKDDQIVLLINNYGGLSNLELGALADEVIIQLDSAWKISPVRIYFDPALLTAVLRRGCDAAIAAEPKLTEWDMVMGDGDCGEAVKGVSEAIIALLDGPHSIAADGSIFTALFVILQAVDDMGGTLGAILGILLSAFTSELQKSPSRDGLSLGLYSTALAAAAESLKQYTAAREGDRTVMDVLLPFAKAFASSNDFSSAVNVAVTRPRVRDSSSPSLEGQRVWERTRGKNYRIPERGPCLSL